MRWLRRLWALLTCSHTWTFLERLPGPLVKEQCIYCRTERVVRR